ncbi:MAG: hypothetical protein OXU63_16385 [Acidobacteriota bacterium]|nr:hypothetical protein [Acidobacteriota bacterium]
MRTNWVRPPLLALTLAAIAAQPALAQFQAGEPAQSRNDPADTILDGGNVYTPDGWAESIAIRDGVIVAVGDSASVAAFRTDATSVWVNTMALEVAGIDRDTPDPEGGIIEPAAANDAAHIAIAAVNQVDYLVTWNFRHIANATMRARIEDACRRAGRRPPVICSPNQIMEP